MNETPWHMAYVEESKPDTYAPGAIVTLVTDGPDMAVIDHCAACNMVTVCWFDQNGYNEQVLPVEVLIDI
ncbi:MAG: hypothetical protein CL535_16415 [Ahrensia sp.]|nr:hypothetical protein [Ahrensia sp.]MBV48158.1 hypothetical protein [Roseobacter sp.]MBV48259.1 hypothetical protein [Roseobacter sp.]|tara:strand:- start:131826 stop:132035 length:210 start_codon:yes stop_codon:yes gene_type:complete